MSRLFRTSGVMAVSVSGSVFSSLCFQHSHAQADQEGFLLGHLFKHVTSTISDSQINNTKEEAKIYVNGYVPLNGVCNWYDGAGRIDQKKIRTVLGKENSQAIVGWYRSRRNSTMRLSLREKALHSMLPLALQNVPPDKFIFGLFTTSKTSNLAIHSFDHVFLQYDGGQFQPLQVAIANLGNTAHEEYRFHPNMNLDLSAHNYFTDALESYQSEFYDVKSGTLQQVFSLSNLDTQLHSKLKDMSDEVAHSEAELEDLRRIVENMELQYNQATPPPKELPASVPMQLDDDPFGNAPLNKGLNKKRLASPKRGSPAQPSVQKPSVKIATSAIHEDLLSLSMDPTPKLESHSSVDEESDTKLKPQQSKNSPQMSTRSGKQKLTAAEVEALDTHPIMEPQKSDADKRDVTVDKVEVPKPKGKGEDHFDFVSDLMKTSTLPKASTVKGSAKMKASKSADTGLASEQSKSSVKTRASSKDPIQKQQAAKEPADVDMEIDNDEKESKEYTLSSSPCF